jgi:hypothetical protein
VFFQVDIISVISRNLVAKLPASAISEIVHVVRVNAIDSRTVLPNSRARNPKHLGTNLIVSQGSIPDLYVVDYTVHKLRA